MPSRLYIVVRKTWLSAIARLSFLKMKRTAGLILPVILLLGNVIPVFASERDGCDMRMWSIKAYVTDNEMGALFASTLPDVQKRHFAWGAEVGSSVDLTGNNLTTFDANIYAGWKNALFPIAGVGIGIQRSIGNSNTFIPVFGLLRTSFRTKPSRFFFNLKAGYSVNTIAKGKKKGGFFCSPGIGMALNQAKRVQTYVLLSYGYYHLNEQQVNEIQPDIRHIDFAQISIGITF